MSIALRWCLVLGLGFALLACDGDGGNDGPMSPGDQPVDASGSYAATFTATRADGCGGLVPTGSTTGTLVVVQNGSSVTLRIRDLSENILSDPTGTIDDAGNFAFDGPITVGDGTDMVDAQGTITGTFTRGGVVDLAFSFTAFTCEVEGTITGQK